MISENNVVWRVFIWEHERGWGCRVDETKDFHTKELAKAFIEVFNAENTADKTPDWYMKATGPKQIITPKQ